GGGRPLPPPGGALGGRPGNPAAPPPSASPARGTLTVAARPPPPRGAGRGGGARWGGPARRDERPMTESHDPFDEKAATWDDDPAKVERARVVADALRDAVPPGPTTRLLEYGAGTGDRKSVVEGKGGGRGGRRRVERDVG